MSTLIGMKIVEDHIAVVTLNRPEAANALSKELLDELNMTLNQLNQDASIYCTIITGASEKAFCAGADLKERKGMSNTQVINTVRYIGETVTALEKMQMPVIDRKSTRLNSSHVAISYAVFCLKKKKTK